MGLLERMRRASLKGDPSSCAGHRNIIQLFSFTWKTQCLFRNQENFSLSRERNGKMHQVTHTRHLTNTKQEQPHNQGGKVFLQKTTIKKQETLTTTPFLIDLSVQKHYPIISNAIIHKDNPGTRYTPHPGRARNRHVDVVYPAIPIQIQEITPKNCFLGSQRSSTPYLNKT